jgi:hypothetical protein
MPWMGFEPTIPVPERAKAVHALDRAATVIGLILITKYDQVSEDKLGRDCSTHRGKTLSIQDIGRKARWNETTGNNFKYVEG